jgi:quinoprotein glucose dehydrogenase
MVYHAWPEMFLQIFNHRGLARMKSTCVVSCWTRSVRIGLAVWTLIVASAVMNSPIATGQIVDDSPLPVRYEPAFPELRPRRPVVITNAGDGSNRLFVVTQQGVVHAFENRPEVEETMTYLDIESKVVYSDNQNEEGLLGLAFHPQYKQNGYFFVYYTTKDAPRTSVISRFQVSKDDPNRADPDSELELMRIAQPFWNHNGGTLVFGPDGYLYVGLGDGGAADDPLMNGQNLKTLLGSILRIDVDNRDEGLNYAIPRDNPFAGQPRYARGEIYAYGFRNVWRMSFDRETGLLWAADVGQDLWEEINLVQAGGNYGWNLREGKHPFGAAGSPARPGLIEPVWEYHHDIGKSITGGNVYRGQRVPELVGHYVYGDYVSGRLWGLHYDPAKDHVHANRPIAGDNIPVITFGEDESGELYFSDSFGRLFHFVKSE